MFAIVAVTYAILLPNIYKSEAILAPAELSGNSSLSKVAGQFGGLAALAGVSLGGSQSNKADLAVEVMKSRQFVEGFIKKHDLLVPIMASKGWKPSSDELVYDDEIYNTANNEWIREPSGLRGVVPTSQEAYDVFSKEIFSVTQDKESGLYNVSVLFYSPHIAKEWVDWLVSDINSVMRVRAIDEARKNLQYLENQLVKTSFSEMQNTFYKLIEEQTKTLMLAEVQEEFAFKVIDPAVVPEVKSKPGRAMISIFGLVLGGILGVAIVLVRFAFSNED
ncbi:LPS O-antigen length regulator, partial [Vibrio sp. 2-2(9)]